MTRASQLRIFTIEDGKMDEFLAAWVGGVVPLRRQFGFDIDGAWVDRQENHFVWLLSYEGPEGFQAGDAQYYESAERGRLAPDPAGYVVAVDGWFVEPVAVD